MKIESNTINSIFSQNRIAMVHNAKSAFHRHSQLSTLNLTTHVDLILHIPTDVNHSFGCIFRVASFSHRNHFLYIFPYNNRLHGSLMFCENCLVQYRTMEIPVIISSLLIRNIFCIYFWRTWFVVDRNVEAKSSLFSVIYTHNDGDGR